MRSDAFSPWGRCDKSGDVAIVVVKSSILRKLAVATADQASGRHSWRVANVGAFPLRRDRGGGKLGCTVNAQGQSGQSSLGIYLGTWTCPHLKPLKASTAAQNIASTKSGPNVWGIVRVSLVSEVR